MKKILTIAAILITLPALIVAVYAIFAGRPLMLVAALASVGLNSLPFLAAAFLFKGGDSGDLGH